MHLSLLSNMFSFCFIVKPWVKGESIASNFAYLVFASEGGAGINWMQNSFKLLRFRQIDVKKGLGSVYFLISFLNLYSKESNLQKKIWLIYFPYCSQFCIGRVFKALLNSPFQLFASSNFPLTYIIPKRKGQGHQRAQVLNPATLQSKRRLHQTWQQRVFGHCEKISKLILYFQHLKFFPPIMRFFSV